MVQWVIGLILRGVDLTSTINQFNFELFKKIKFISKVSTKIRKYRQLKNVLQRILKFYI